MVLYFFLYFVIHGQNALLSRDYYLYDTEGALTDTGTGCGA